MIKQVVVIQCQLAQNRCSGFACSNSFYERAWKFEGVDPGARYMSFNCGGCCGKAVSARLGNLATRMKKQAGFSKEEVAVYLSSCMTTDNHHSDRCPHIDFIKDMIRKQGFEHVVEGTYFSKTATHKREQGIYKTY